MTKENELVKESFIDIQNFHILAHDTLYLIHRVTPELLRFVKDPHALS